MKCLLHIYAIADNKGDEEVMSLLTVGRDIVECLNLFQYELENDPDFANDKHSVTYARNVGVVADSQLPLFVRYALVSNQIVVYPTNQTPQYTLEELKSKSEFMRQAIALLEDVEDSTLIEVEVHEIMDKLSTIKDKTDTHIYS